MDCCWPEQANGRLCPLAGRPNEGNTKKKRHPSAEAVSHEISLKMKKVLTLICEQGLHGPNGAGRRSPGAVAAQPERFAEVILSRGGGSEQGLKGDGRRAQNPMGLVRRRLDGFGARFEAVRGSRLAELPANKRKVKP